MNPYLFAMIAGLVSSTPRTPRPIRTDIEVREPPAASFEWRVCR